MEADPLPNQVQDLLGDLDSLAAAPSGQQKEKLAELTPLVNDASAQVKKIAEEDLPALNKKMNDAGYRISRQLCRKDEAGVGETKRRNLRGYFLWNAPAGLLLLAPRPGKSQMREPGSGIPRQE